MLRVYIFLLFLLGCHAANAAGRREIQIVQADAARSYRMGDATINRLVGNVVLLHNNTLMNCDSAYLYPDQRFEAFGNVVIHKDTTWLYGNYLDYRSAVSTGKIRGKIVTLLDGKLRLRTKYIDFNSNENSAHFWDGGVIDNMDNLLESRQGTYYSKQKLAIFYRSVEMRNPDYRIATDSMHYFTERELVKFWGTANLWGDSTFMQSRSGYYDRGSSHVFLCGNAYAQSAKQEAWADSVHYYRDSKIGYFYNNIQVVDTQQRSILFGDYAILTDEPQTATVTQNPSAALYGQKPQDDTMFVRADTLLIFSMPRSLYQRRMQRDTLAIPEDTAAMQPALPAPEKPALCDLWRIPCNDGYAPAYAFNNQHIYSAATDYTRFLAAAGTGMPVPYLPPPKVDKDFLTSSIQWLFADSAYARALLDTFNHTAMFEDYARHLPFVDSMRRQSAGDSAVIAALRVEHERDLAAIKGYSAAHAADSAAIAALQRDNAKRAAAMDSMQRSIDGYNNRIKQWRSQHAADSARIQELLIQQRRYDALLKRLANYVDADSGVAAALQQMMQADSIIIPAAADSICSDTAYIAPKQDSMRLMDKLMAHYGLTFLQDNDTMQTDAIALPALDTAMQDTLVKRFLAYRNVRFFHRDMQGKCDSFIYIVSDSLGEMHRDPIIWNDNNQISADKIDIRHENGQIHQVELTQAAFVAAWDDTIQDYFNQIKGSSMLIHFANNNVYRMDVFSGGQSVYYMRDKGKLSGVQKGASTDMVIRLRHRQIQKIDYLTKPETSIIPVRDIQVEEMLLKGFSWRSALRPRSRWEICQRAIVPSYRQASMLLEQPKFPVYEQILLLEQSRQPYTYPAEAGVINN